MSKQTYIFFAIGIAVILTAIVVLFQLNQSDKSLPEDGENQRGMSGDPTDITLDFYSVWLERKGVAGVNEATENPLDSMALSHGMQEKLQDFDFSASNTELDPVLCQTTLPSNLKAKPVFKKETEQQLLVFPADKGGGRQAVVLLEKHNDLWEIVDITCSNAEQAAESSEFTFDNEGYLLKDSLPSVFNKDYWYLIFEQDNTFGHTAPLLLDDESTCVDKNKAENVCTHDTFYETMRVHIQGAMSEVGVEAKRIEILQ